MKEDEIAEFSSVEKEKKLTRPEIELGALIDEEINAENEKLFLYYIEQLIGEGAEWRSIGRERKEDLRVDVYSFNEYGRVELNFSQPILLPPGMDDFKPSNKISGFAVSSWDYTIGNYTHTLGNLDFTPNPNEDELLFTFNYTQVNSTYVNLQLTFKRQVSDPGEGPPDILFVKLKSIFVFVSEKWRMPILEDNIMINTTMPLQVLPEVDGPDLTGL
jgi:hypothetical protein